LEATHEHAHEERTRPREDWNSDEFVAYWIEQQKDRAPVRRRQFVLLRAFVPKTPEQEFRYINLGAGPGYLEEVLLEQFPNAQATLVDGSLAMLGAARQRLERYEDRIEYVQANLGSPDWTGAVSGPFDLAVSTIAIHNLRDAGRIRALYAEVFKLIGHGGMFLNFDYIRSTHPSVVPLGRWAARDAEANLMGRGGGGMPGTLQEQLGWLNEAGFAAADVLWKDLNIALMCGIRDHLHLPDEEHGHDGHDHAHH
jgi:tRNA (cmo5U34)-methyltransferase